MSRAILTHFDGDPFFLNFWLLLYNKYWRGECDKIYMGISYKPFISEEVRKFNAWLLKDYPEIQVTYFNTWLVPEKVNPVLYSQVKEDLVGFIESDGFVYEKGVVAQCFKLLEEGQEVVAPEYPLIEKGTFQNGIGFMRCFFFAQKAILDKIDMDFMPKKITSGPELDCFGWISWQLLGLNPQITYIPSNTLSPDNILNQNSNFKLIHIRQMMSSAVGIGGGRYYDWLTKPSGMSKEIQEQLNPVTRNEFTYNKAIAFRLLFLDMANNFELIPKFLAEYKFVLDMVVYFYKLPIEKIYEIKGYYKALLKI